MTSNVFFDYVHVDNYSSTPKYLQLAHAILGAIEQGKIERNNLLPSLNELTDHLEISRETADRGYRYLRYMGILKAVPGKGHYISTTEVKNKLRICLLLNKISDGKILFYQTLVKTLGNHVALDFYVYHNDFYLFKKIVTRQIDYSYYVIMPHFTDNEEAAEQLINTLPKNKLILLDRQLKHIKGHFTGVYENFEQDIYSALEQALKQLSKYHTIKLIFPERTYLPRAIKNGFSNFCRQYAFEREVITKIKNHPLRKGEVYICLNDDDLTALLEAVAATSLQIGVDIGIISYNETPLKKYIAGGITTISTDYEQMALLATKSIKEKQAIHTALNFCLALRNSL